MIAFLALIRSMLRDAPRSLGMCGSCAHFANEPQLMEQSIPGLMTMSSGHASVRADDGFCARHDRYVRARYGCGDFFNF